MNTEMNAETNVAMNAAMNAEQLLQFLRTNGLDISLADGKLMLRGDESVLQDGDILAQLRAAKPLLIALLQAEQGQSLGAGSAVAVPNLIPAACTRITPQMLPLVTLQQEQIEAIAAKVAGGMANIQDIYPLAALQEGILFHHLLAGEQEQAGDPYLMSFLLEMDSFQHLQNYLDALRYLITRHDLLRTSIAWEGLDEAVQVVWREAPLLVQEVRFEASAGTDLAQALRTRFDPRHFRIDLSQAPLRRIYWCHDAAHDGGRGRYLLLELSHHVVTDHSTREIMHREMAAFLLARQQGQPLQLPPAQGFREFIAQVRQSGQRALHEEFFTRMLGDVSESCIAFDVADVQGDGSNIRELHLDLPPELNAGLRQAARQNGVSAASLFHLAWALVIARCSGREDVVFGTVLLGRMQSGAQMAQMLGVFINTLPLRLKLGQLSVSEAVRATHALFSELLRHEHAPLALAQRCSQLQAPAPLFTSLLNYRHVGMEDSSHGDAAGRQVWQGIRFLQDKERSNYPLTMSVNDLGQEFSLDAQVDIGLDADLICRLYAQTLSALLQALQQGGQMPVVQLDILPTGLKQQLLLDWNAQPCPYPQDLCWHQMLEQQVLRTPQALALKQGELCLSYAEFNQRANRLAHHLRSLGLAPDDRVAVCAERSPDLIVALFAIMKAGAAYVPLDPVYPDDRLAYMLEDSQAKVLLCDAGRDLQAMIAQAVSRNRDSLQVLDLVHDQALWAQQSVENPVCADLRPDHLAYLIYTSGSTGKPKGVMVEHRGLCNLSQYLGRCMQVTPEARVLQCASISFDASVLEMCMTFAHGASLHMGARGQLLAGESLLHLMTQANLTHAMLTPAVLAALPETASLPASLPGLRHLMLGAEALPPALVARWGQGRHLHNVYGPTEATVFMTAYRCQPELVAAGGSDAHSVPIGRSIENTRVYLLDAQRQLVPPGVSGEIWLGGAGVARGYWQRPEMSAERFVADPFFPGGRMYGTGDLARWRADGQLEYLGRNDFQIKLRGFRIELGEIETCLAAMPGVQSAHVLVQGEGEQKRLLAYYTSHDGLALNEEALRTHLSAHLPQHMLPAACMHLAQMPLTPNGKLDRKALPLPEQTRIAGADWSAPQPGLESTLAQQWQQMLQVAQVGRNDHFFAMGGHSLLAVSLISRLKKQFACDIGLKDLFAAPRLCDFAALLQEKIQGGTELLLPPIPVLPRAARLPLSLAQQRLWFLSQIEGQSAAYHIPFARRLHGKLNVAALQAALNHILRRHETLRSSFYQEEGQAWQRIAAVEQARFALQMVDLRAHAAQESVLRAQMEEEAAAPFDLQTGPLVRGRLLQLGDEEYALLITMHHIISDGWSVAVFIEELSALYRAACEADAGQIEASLHAALPDLTLQYVDYCAWQREQLQGEFLQNQSAYWQQQLRAAPVLLELPTDFPRPPEQDHLGEFIDFSLDPDLSAALQGRARDLGMTPYMFMLSAWALLLSRLAGQDEVVIGTPSANRSREETEKLIGFFLSTLALRVNVQQAATLQDLLLQVKTTLLQAQQHQDLPFEQVVELLRPPRSLAHSPLFQALFVWQNMPHGKLVLPQVEMAHMELAFSPASKFDLSFYLGEEESADGMRYAGGLQFATALFKRSTIATWLGYFKTLLQAMSTAGALSRHPQHLALLDAAQQSRIVHDWNQTGASFPHQLCLHERFEQQAARSPQALALVVGTERWTYQDLNAESNRLAHYLRVLGARPGVKIGLCTARSSEMMIGMLAVLKAGAAYVPLDVAYPAERLAYMLEDSACSILLKVGEDMQAGAQALHLACSLDLRSERSKWAQQSSANLSPAAVGLQADDLAYVMYTSGSTGKPKGAQVRQSAVHNLVHWYLQATALSAQDKVLIVSSHSFDLTQRNLFAPLFVGAQLHLADEPFAPRAIVQQIAQQGISMMNLTSTALHALIDADAQKLSGLRLVVLGGEACQPARLLQIPAPRPAFMNAYGPTECSGVSVFHHLEANLEQYLHTPVPLGRPIANARIYILDQAGQVLPPGVAGEIHIGGLPVCAGYLNREELNQQVFVPDPYATHAEQSGARMYKTGDVGRFRADGVIESLGRRDHQVKIRGFRIELGEIENALRKLDQIQDAVVIAREDVPGEKRLVAYLVLKSGMELGELSALRAHLTAQLPDYMVPAAYVQLAALPLTPSRKLDRKALPAPDENALAKRGYVAPEGEIETKIAALWAQMLRVPQVGREDNFFELGGHSLLAVSLIERMRQMDLEASVRSLFASANLAAFAATTREIEEFLL